MFHLELNWSEFFFQNYIFFNIYIMIFSPPHSIQDRYGYWVLNYSTDMEIDRSSPCCSHCHPHVFSVKDFSSWTVIYEDVILTGDMRTPPRCSWERVPWDRWMIYGTPNPPSIIVFFSGWFASALFIFHLPSIFYCPQLKSNFIFELGPKGHIHTSFNPFRLDVTFIDSPKFSK